MLNKIKKLQELINHEFEKIIAGIKSIPVVSEDGAVDIPITIINPRDKEPKKKPTKH